MPKINLPIVNSTSHFFPLILNAMISIFILWLCAGEIKQEDVGLKPEMAFFSSNNPRRTPKITYLHIYECQQFSVTKL